MLSHFSFLFVSNKKKSGNKCGGGFAKYERANGRSTLRNMLHRATRSNTTNQGTRGASPRSGDLTRSADPGLAPLGPPLGPYSGLHVHFPFLPASLLIFSLNMEKLINTKNLNFLHNSFFLIYHLACSLFLECLPKFP